MNNATRDFERPGHETQPIPGFPHAPFDWSREQAEEVAQTEGLELTDVHWEVVRALQKMCTQKVEPALNASVLHDALDEKFHAQGGIKYLYQLFPKGPLAQGCRLAGVKPPAGAQDQGMGSAV